MADVRVYQFVSRNKDNKEVDGFKERKKLIYSDKPVEEVEKEFSHFVADGVIGEKSRMYVSLNARDDAKARLEFMAWMVLDNGKTPTSKLHAKFVAFLMKCPKEKKWLFDFDYTDEKDVLEFCKDIEAYGVKPHWKRSVFCFAVWTDRGFDTREVLAKWKDCENKKDGMLFWKISEKH